MPTMWGGGGGGGDENYDITFGNFIPPPVSDHLVLEFWSLR